MMEACGLVCRSWSSWRAQRGRRAPPPPLGSTASRREIRRGSDGGVAGFDQEQRKVMSQTRVALVTGGARGQGLAIVRRLRADGFAVAACDVLVDELEQEVAE